MSEKLERERSRGVMAKQVLDNPIFQETFTAVKAHLFEKLSKSKPNEIDVREDIYQRMQCLDMIEAQIRKVINGGQVAEQSLINKIRNKTGL